MLKDANPRSFSGIYIVCGYTDLRYGIDSLAAIIETKYHLPFFVPGTLFLFCGRKSNKVKGLVWEGDGFLLVTKRIESGHFKWPRHSADAKRLPVDYPFAYGANETICLIMPTTTGSTLPKNHMSMLLCLT